MRSNVSSLRVRFIASLVVVFSVTACGGGEQEGQVEPNVRPSADQPAEQGGKQARDEARDPQPEAELEWPVPLYEDGKVVRHIEGMTAEANGYLVVDLGDEWTPYLFSERSDDDEEPIRNPYRETYLALANGEFPRDHHGERAKNDRYLELYGIAPTLSWIRKRFEKSASLECAKGLDYAPLEAFEGLAVYISNDRAKKDAQRYRQGKALVEKLKKEQGVSSHQEVDTSGLKPGEARLVRDYDSLHLRVPAIKAAQERLKCEGYLRAKHISGSIDWVTHEALATFERRHRVYGWGFVGKETMEFLRATPLEGDRRSLLRVLTERAIHTAGIIEDDSRTIKPDGEPFMYVGADGKRHPMRDLVSELEANVVAAFGLDTPEKALAFMRSLGDLAGHRYVAIKGVELPEYYSDDMRLSVQIDRGDVWYEFPFDDQGNDRPQPVSRRPRLSIFTEYLGQKIALARFGTTIGGWRTESVDDAVMWKYKNSPVGRRVWERIVAAPVWLPPESTPPRGLLTRSSKPGERFAVNFHEMGPSYASAYGLVAAYHRKYTQDADGNIRILGDEGIRTHGSVDYMSIMRRHSHGCHRLHNHIAVRLMSFVLRHRPHARKGPDPIAFGRKFEYDGKKFDFLLTQGGYAYELAEPLFVDVLEGRIRGNVSSPIAHAIPRFDKEAQAYVTPDAGVVTVDRYGRMTEVIDESAAAQATEVAMKAKFEASSTVPVSALGLGTNVPNETEAQQKPKVERESIRIPPPALPNSP
jgi:hypothetical protein